MTIFHKRVLILFSVALNIGFVIVTIAMVVHHPRSSQDRSRRELIEIVQRLDLSEAKERDALDTINRFRGTVDRHDNDLNQARRDVLRYLATSGPVDPIHLNRLIETVALEENRKGRAFEAHVIDLRRQLGEEKGALFFSLLLAHLDAKNNLPRR